MIDKERKFLCDYHKLMRQKRTGMEWKEAVTTEFKIQKRMYNWRAFGMLEYIRQMIEDGKLGREIIDVIYNYEDWIMDEVND